MTFNFEDNSDVTWYLQSFSSSNLNEIWHVNRGRCVMHDVLSYDPIQGQDHKTLKVENSSVCNIKVWWVACQSSTRFIFCWYCIAGDHLPGKPGISGNWLKVNNLTFQFLPDSFPIHFSDKMSGKFMVTLAILQCLDSILWKMVTMFSCQCFNVVGWLVEMASCLYKVLFHCR